MRTILIFTLLALLTVTSANAQVANETSLGASAPQSAWPWSAQARERTEVSSSNPLADNIKLSYYDPSLGTHEWQAPILYTPLTFLVYGQRMTLPGDAGLVDSVRVRIGPSDRDSVIVALTRDTLFETSAGLVHLINIWMEDPDYASMTVAVRDTQPGGWLTVPFNKVRVDKHFFVTITPPFDELEPFTIYGDSSGPRPLTTEDARSAYVALTPQQQIWSAVLDGTVTFNGEETPAYSNLYMEAYVDVSSLSVERDVMEPAALYPNPVALNGKLHIAHSSMIRRVELQNVLGNSIASFEGLDNKMDISTAGLPSGIYHLLITTDDGITTEKLVIQ